MDMARLNLTSVGDRTDGHRQISINSVGVGGFNVWSVYIERVQCVVGVGINTRGMMCVKSEEREAGEGSRKVGSQIDGGARRWQLCSSGLTPREDRWRPSFRSQHEDTWIDNNNNILLGTA